MYQRSLTSWTKHLDFMIADLLCLQVAYTIAFWIRFPGKGLPYSHSEYFTLILILSLLQLLVSIFLNNLAHVLKRSLSRELISVTLLSFMTLALSSFFLYSLHVADVYSRLLTYITAGLFIPMDLAARLILKKIVIRRIRSNGAASSRSLLIITEQDRAKEILDELQKEEIEPFNIKGLVLTDSFLDDPIEGIPVVSSLDEAADYICREWIDEVLLYLPDFSPAPRAFLDACAEMGVTVHSVINLHSVESQKQFIERIGTHSVITTAFNYIEPYQAILKRLMDIVGGLIGSIFTIIIGIFICPAIFLASPGPVIFRQRRVGKNGKPFYILKFRTMYLDAEDRKAGLVTDNRVQDGYMFKLDFDPRVIGNKTLPDGTHKYGLGEFLRKTSLDEFPQFFNILKGEMSLVGTRPPTLDEWEKYEYHHRARLAVKPGLTGMWQVSGRSQITDFETVVKLDTEYITHFRLSLDIKILLKTIIVLIQRRGAM